jgi:hydroxyethylthiazole kinase
MDTAATASRTWADASVAADLARVREHAPLTHCFTNLVVTNFTANLLLAAGASPAMVFALEEVEDFAAIAGGVLINVGTVTAIEAEAMRATARAARAAGTPWVLDPVAVGGLRLRTDLAAELAGHGPAIVRGNASEILALAGIVAPRAGGAGGTAGGGRGVDSTASAEEAVEAARALARATGAVVAVSGAVDHITDGDALITVPGGDPLLTRVTGVGCALGALMAAFLAVTAAPLDAAVSASAVMAQAGERAAAASAGPGSFAVALLDEVARLAG